MYPAATKEKIIKMGRIGETRDSLNSSWSALKEQWATTRQHWRDEVGNHFDREWWQQLEYEVPHVLYAMTNLDETLEQALRSTYG